MRWLKTRSVVLLLGLALLTAGAGASRLGGDFTLTDQHGECFRLDQLRGKVVLLFFGYTYCPDICPTQLASIAAVLAALEERALQVQGVFVTVDPERDTPEVLNNYVRYFHEDLIGLTGTAAEIERVARQYRVRYSKYERDDGHYTMDHSAQLYVIDREGTLTSTIPYGFPAEHVLNVVDDLLNTGHRQVDSMTGERN